MQPPIGKPKASLTAFPGGGADIEEPNWAILIPDFTPKLADQLALVGIKPDEVIVNAPLREQAHRHWLRIVAALRDAGTLAAENAHQIQRLTLAYVRYDHASSQMMIQGAVTRAKNGTPMLNMWQVELRQADSDATTAEMELGITPRRRGQTAPAKKQAKKSTAADAYLKPVRL